MCNVRQVQTIVEGPWLVACFAAGVLEASSGTYSFLSIINDISSSGKRSLASYAHIIRDQTTGGPVALKAGQTDSKTRKKRNYQHQRILPRKELH